MLCARLLGNGTRRALLSSFRRYASVKPAAPAPPAPRLPRPPSELRRPSLSQRVDFHRVQKLAIAEKLFDKGVRRLYTAPSRRLASFRFHAYALGSLFVVLVYVFLRSGYLDRPEYTRRGTPIWVYYTFLGTSLALAVVGGVSISRAAGHVKTLDLIKRSDQIFLQLSVTRLAPFVKPRTMIVPLHDFKVKYKVLGQSMPDYGRLRKSINVDSKSDSASSFVSKFFYSVFSGAKQFFIQEGMFNVEVVQSQDKSTKSSRYLMDVLGDYERLEDKDKIEALFAITTLVDPNGTEI